MRISSNPVLYLEPNPPRHFGAVLRLIIDAIGGRTPQTDSLFVDPLLIGPLPINPLLIDSREWPALWAALERHHVGSLLRPLVSSGVLGVPAEAEAEVAASERNAAMVGLQLGRAAAEVTELLNKAGIETRVLKGLATGRLDMPDGWIRRTSDVDLLAKPDQFGEACAALRNSGCVSLRPELPVDLLVEDTLTRPDGIEIDLHHRLFRFGPAADTLLFADPVRLPDGIGHAMSREARLVNAVAHLMIAPPGHRTGSSLIDVAVLSVSPGLDEDRVGAISSAVGIRDLVRAARWISESVGLESPDPAPDMSRTLINYAYLRTNRSIPLETLAVLRDQGSWSRRLRYVVYAAGKLRP